MKKSFMFVAVAAAGMLASCSSDSLTAGPDPKIEPTQEDLVPIEISVATPMARSGMTRGTGTVGGVEKSDGTPVNNDGSTTSPAPNIWAGQEINVYMFDKGTLNIAQFNGVDIFNNAKMDTPPASAATASGLAHYVDPTLPLTGRYLIKYYPLSGAYDFWGYRIDDAVVTAAAAKNGAGDTLRIGITVDGTQDVLGAKTTDPDISGTTLTTADLYSAKAARQLIQPVLEFNHLMTRLTFEAYPGNDNAKSVYVTGIRVKALKEYDSADPTATVYNTPDGTLDIAGTATGFVQKIAWTTNTAAPVAFELLKRDITLGQDSYTGILANSWCSLNSDATNNKKFITKADYDLLPASDPGDGSPYQGLYTVLAPDSWYELNDYAGNNKKFITAAAFGALAATATGDVDGNQNLIPLIDNTILDGSGNPDWDYNGAISMNVATSNTEALKKAIGDAIIAPDAKAYEIEIDLVQKAAKYEDSDPATPADWDEYQFNSIKTVVKLDGGATSFDPGYTYDFIFKVYGLEKIDVRTVLKPWIWGENQTIITE